MTAASITTSSYAERLAAALKASYGDSRSAAKQCAGTVGAGIGTARKWFAGENGADAVHLIKLMADNEEIFRLVCEMAGRADAADRARAMAAVREAKRLLDGVELP